MLKMLDKLYYILVDISGRRSYIAWIKLNFHSQNRKNRAWNESTFRILLILMLASNFVRNYEETLPANISWLRLVNKLAVFHTPSTFPLRRNILLTERKKDNSFYIFHEIYWIWWHHESALKCLLSDQGK